MSPWISLLYLLGNFQLSWTLPIAAKAGLQQDDVLYAEEYLKSFYHLKEGRGTRSRREMPAMEAKIREMQEFFGLEVTGGLNPQTVSVMRRARCGVSDAENYSFYPEKSKWKNHTITYRVVKYTSDLKKEDVDKSFQWALKIWSDVAPLKFVKVDQGEADMMITFGSKAHGDFFPFDGPKGVLAHAFEPSEGIGGDTHFDDDEIWSMGNKKPGYNLFTVAAHEFGHALGLSHSKDPSALMYPNYKYYNVSTYTLSRDDRLGIQELYGMKRSTFEAVIPQDCPTSYHNFPFQGTTSGRTQEVLTVPEKCDPNLSFDAVAAIGREIYFFKNSYMWIRTTWWRFWSKIREGSITTFIPSISSPIDAAYDIPAKGVAYIFTGPKYWLVQQLNMKSYSSSIYNFGFPSSVKKVDAAVHVKDLGKTYFFVGDVYYRYDEARSKMDPGFPRKIRSDWPGIGSKIDSAFELAGYIHFFSGSKAYKYSYRHKRLLNSVKVNSWLGC
ncbi:matrix metalloproteinase-20-like [Amia ocellicauda]|uniref:matrix metalloproteinase-20-like n=1 Tax=Amia ocellicauda TaxID=2972642 RepID=UPI003463B124